MRHGMATWASCRQIESCRSCISCSPQGTFRAGRTCRQSSQTHCPSGDCRRGLMECFAGNQTNLLRIVTALLSYDRLHVGARRIGHWAPIHFEGRSSNGYRMVEVLTASPVFNCGGFKASNGPALQASHPPGGHRQHRGGTLRPRPN